MTSGRDGGGDEGSGLSPSDEEAALAERLRALQGKLQDRRVSRGEADNPRPSGGGDMGQALRLGSEFVAGILVGAGIGWAIDRWLGTSPFGLMVFLLLGFIAGVLNVLRLAGLVTTPKLPPPGGSKPADKG